MVSLPAGMWDAEAEAEQEVIVAVRPWRTPVPAAFWPWARWVLSGDRKHGKQMPEEARAYFHKRKIKVAPPDWRIHLEWIARKPRPKPPAPQQWNFGIAGTGNGVLMTHPGGDAELAPELLAANFTYVLFNIGDYAADKWLDARMQASSRGLLYGPWARLDPEFRGEGRERCNAIERVADEWGSVVCGHNNEKEAERTFSPEEHAACLKGRTSRTRIVPTEGWVQNIDWSPLGKIEGVVASPETFLNVRADLHPKVCVDHAIEQGFRAGLPMFGVGSMGEGLIPVPPKTYFSQWPGLFLLYPGNGLVPHEWDRRMVL